MRHIQSKRLLLATIGGALLLLLVLLVQATTALILDAFLAACALLCFKQLKLPLWQGLLAACLIVTPY